MKHFQEKSQQVGAKWEATAARCPKKTHRGTKKKATVSLAATTAGKISEDAAVADVQSGLDSSSTGKAEQRGELNGSELVLAHVKADRRPAVVANGKQSHEKLCYGLVGIREDVGLLASECFLTRAEHCELTP